MNNIKQDYPQSSEVCPLCADKGKEVYMVIVEGVVNRTTDPMHDDEFGEWLECPECGNQEDYIKEAEYNE